MTHGSINHGHAKLEYKQTLLKLGLVSTLTSSVHHTVQSTTNFKAGVVLAARVV